MLTETPSRDYFGRHLCQLVNIIFFTVVMLLFDATFSVNTALTVQRSGSCLLQQPSYPLDVSDK